MKLKIFTLCLLITSFECFSNSTEFCFSRNISLKGVKRYLSTILLPSDKLYYRRSNHCVEIVLTKERVELFTKYLSRRYRDIKVISSSTAYYNVAAKNHKVTIVKTGNSNSSNNDIAIGKRGKLKNVTTTSSSRSTTTLLLSGGLKGEIEMDGERVEITCKERGGRRFEIRLFIKDSKGNSISTAITVAAGQKIEIGSVVRDLKNKNRDLSIKKGVGFSNQKGRFNERYELTVR